MIKQGPQVFRYVVQDRQGLLKIIEMINGNLVLNKRQAGFERFVEAYNKRYSETVEVKKTRHTPTLKDS